MAKRMLIDATYPEETRVAVVNGKKLEDYDFEVKHRKQIKGTIFLAKIMRVEPSLQAAFVDYGGNRHGFLPFGEIHPDYYRIPVEDRPVVEVVAEVVDKNGDNIEADDEDGAQVEEVGGDDLDTLRHDQPNLTDRYKIQDVIKRRQIMLVQVTKEERGNKGAAVTTYLSLPGRYCVLMPNTIGSGGISRKISNIKDRKRLKDILAELNPPSDMSVILRTAGMTRTKNEIKRDLDYLLRMWDSIRELTLSSTAPTPIYEEGDLIKRAIRDLYARDIDEVFVSGDEGYRQAKDFMRLLMPSHARRVQPYKEADIPLFVRYQVESQIEAIHSPIAGLKSGGYIVINPTEALVSIDVNSGRSTKERDIEDTALRTNLEAAEEIALQLRLRDLGGLIVIDFIDMEDTKNNQAVERKLKDAMRNDRARIQLGRISPFGLLELSRQRMRPSLLETHFDVCPHCKGIGHVRTVESAALYVLRAIEEEGLRKRSNAISVRLATPVAMFLLNTKRMALTEIESRHRFAVELIADPDMAPADIGIEKAQTAFAEKSDSGALSLVATATAAMEEWSETETVEKAAPESEEAENEHRKKRRRGGRRRSKPRTEGETRVVSPQPDAETAHEEAPNISEVASESGEEIAKPEKKKRRRGKRGGKGRRPGGETTVAASGETPATPADVIAEPAPVAVDPVSEPVPFPLPAPKPDPQAHFDVTPTVVDLAPRNDSAAENDMPKKGGWWRKTK
ncbi:MAG: Rne/Rng family ribonuclease [Pseudomonadota bacterium]|nr:Rne/Rng family ribonuclease [Pseudomonadota bacterium]